MRAAAHRADAEDCGSRKQNSRAGLMCSEPVLCLIEEGLLQRCGSALRMQQSSARLSPGDCQRADPEQDQQEYCFHIGMDAEVQAAFQKRESDEEPDPEAAAAGLRVRHQHIGIFQQRDHCRHNQDKDELRTLCRRPGCRGLRGSRREGGLLQNHPPHRMVHRSSADDRFLAVFQQKHRDCRKGCKDTAEADPGRSHADRAHQHCQHNDVEHQRL